MKSIVGGSTVRTAGKFSRTCTCQSTHTLKGLVGQTENLKCGAGDGLAFRALAASPEDPR